MGWHAWTCLEVLKEMAEALKFLHEHRIIHGDLKVRLFKHEKKGEDVVAEEMTELLEVPHGSRIGGDDPQDRPSTEPAHAVAQQHERFRAAQAGGVQLLVGGGKGSGVGTFVHGHGAWFKGRKMLPGARRGGQPAALDFAPAHPINERTDGAGSDRPAHRARTQPDARES